VTAASACETKSASSTEMARPVVGIILPSPVDHLIMAVK
jgi:hypothetical protein